MDGKHPNRKKDKYNPYVLSIEDSRYFLSFTDGQGVFQKMEIGESIYAAFNGFELEDISYLNTVSRYQEHSELTEGTLNNRAIICPEPLEEGVYRKMMYKELHTAISRLPEIQRRRLLMYYFGGYTYEQIAEIEGCKHPAIIKSVAAAEKNLKKYFLK
ncbi:MAG: sigma factor-like helix-turn-helix DNA-binding protein [Eubacteriales bacterium]|nr:sigma factor-like helix-turn-helix DNA-binding protein [Eubacteriales bacterium]